MLSTSEILAVTNQFNKFYSMRITETAMEFHMSKVEMDVLLFLYNNPQFDTARDIVEYRHIAKSYVSKAVELLVKKGALLIKEDTKDRRIIHLEITGKAMEAAKQARRVQERIMEELFQNLTEEEQNLFEKVLRKMSDNIEKESVSNKH